MSRNVFKIEHTRNEHLLNFVEAAQAAVKFSVDSLKTSLEPTSAVFAVKAIANPSGTLGTHQLQQMYEISQKPEAIAFFGHHTQAKHVFTKVKSEEFAVILSKCPQEKTNAVQASIAKLNEDMQSSQMIVNILTTAQALLRPLKVSETRTALAQRLKMVIKSNLPPALNALLSKSAASPSAPGAPSSPSEKKAEKKGAKAGA